ncbi:uncharacterized protein LOC135400754 [Ornithodoros turicata]|uniref:uncharacterized protein LOC135400754 n=1 Tax=Ornithodoros turicata TaxID=34597 RepID=UPI00313929DD
MSTGDTKREGFEAGWRDVGENQWIHNYLREEVEARWSLNQVHHAAFAVCLILAALVGAALFLHYRGDGGFSNARENHQCYDNGGGTFCPLLTLIKELNFLRRAPSSSDGAHVKCTLEVKTTETSIGIPQHSETEVYMRLSFTSTKPIAPMEGNVMVNSNDTCR